MYSSKRTQNFRLVLLLIAMFGIVWLTGCGENYNLNKAFVSEGQYDSFLSVFERAQQHYDQGDFDKALHLAKQAKKLSPDNDKVAILTGYIHLALAGPDTIRIISVLIEDSTTSQTNLASTDDESLKIFELIGKILNYSDADMRASGTVKTSSDISMYDGIDVIEPFDITTLKAQNIDFFNQIDSAIAAICPFMSADEKLVDLDSRHSAVSCTPSANGTDKPLIASFLWMFTHFVEAVAYYQVLQYQEPTSAKAHIQLRADALQSASTNGASIGEYATAAADLAQTVQTIFDNTSNSMLIGMINDLEVVTRSITALGNIPDKIKNKIEKALESVRGINQQTTTQDGQIDNFLAKANKKIGEQLNTQITEYADENPSDFAAEKDEVCGAFAEIMGDNAALPDDCE